MLSLQLCRTHQTNGNSGLNGVLYESAGGKHDSFNSIDDYYSTIGGA
jgi:hypothetical protein